MQKKLLALSLLLLVGAGCAGAAATDSTNTEATDDGGADMVNDADAQADTADAGGDEATESADDAAAEAAAGADVTADDDATAIDVTADATVDMFTVTASNFSFSPSTMTVKKGDTVKVTFKNADGFHDFVIDEFNVSSGRIEGGQETTVTFVADKAGTFEYYCSVGEHRAMGMKGTLTVTE